MNRVGSLNMHTVGQVDQELWIVRNSAGRVVSNGELTVDFGGNQTILHVKRIGLHRLTGAVYETGRS